MNLSQLERVNSKKEIAERCGQSLRTPTERTARLRALRALVRVFAGPAGMDADAAIATAENDPDMIGAAIESFDRLPALILRRALSTYAALHKPRER